MTATAKNVNYTEEQTKALVAAYSENPTKDTVEKFAKMFSKNVRSIVAKLSREGVYIPQAKAEAGKRGQKKEEIADAIGRVLKMPENDVSSLGKANASALKTIFEALANSKPI